MAGQRHALTVSPADQERIAERWDLPRGVTPSQGEVIEAA